MLFLFLFLHYCNFPFHSIISFIIVIYYPSDLRGEEEILELMVFRNSLEIFVQLRIWSFYVIMSRFFLLWNTRFQVTLFELYRYNMYIQC